jgi:hypothetical protein
MDTKKVEQEPAERTEGSPVVSEGSSVTQTEVKPRQATETTTKSLKCKKPKAKPDGTQVKKAGKLKKAKQVATSDEESDSESSDASTDATVTSDSSDESESETEKEKKKRKLKEKKAKQKAKDKKKAKAKRKAKKEVGLKLTGRCEDAGGLTSEQESSDSEMDSESEDENTETDDSEDELQEEEELQKLLQMQQLQQQLQLQQRSLPPPIPQQQQTLSGLEQQLGGLRAPGRGLQLDFGAGDTIARIQAARNTRQLKALGLDASGKQLKKEKKEKKKKRGSKMEYKRVDQLWDNTIHNYKLQDTAEGKHSRIPVVFTC